MESDSLFEGTSKGGICSEKTVINKTALRIHNLIENEPRGELIARKPNGKAKQMYPSRCPFE